MSIFLDSLTEFSYASTTRGRNYYLEGRVLSLKVNDYVCTATVKGSGTHLYKTTIRFSRKFEMTNHNCSCPVGHYCKHAVAVLYKLDRMLDSGELKLNPSEKGEAWQDEVDNIFLKYFSNRYHFNPNYGPLNVYLKNNESILKGEMEDIIFYIISRILDYFYNYHYDLGYIVRFFDLIISSFLSREGYLHVLERFKKNPTSLLSNIGIMLKIDTISLTTNQFLAKVIEDDSLSAYADGLNDIFYVNELTQDNVISLAALCPKLLHQRSLEERIAYHKGKELKNDKMVNYVYALLLAYIKKGNCFHADYYGIVEEIKDKNASYYRHLMLESFLNKRMTTDFVSLVLSFPDYQVDEETLHILEGMKNKPYYLNIYLHKPVNLDDIPLSEIVDLFAIEGFFHGYESYLTEVSLKKIAHAKKLKNYDVDIINGLIILDYLSYPDLVGLLFDKNIKEKFLSTYNRPYYYLLFKHNLLDAIGFKKYGIIG